VKLQATDAQGLFDQGVGVFAGLPFTNVREFNFTDSDYVPFA